MSWTADRVADEYGAILLLIAVIALASSTALAQEPAAPAGDWFASGIDTGSDLDGDGARDLLVFDRGSRGKQARLWLLSGRSGKVLRTVEVRAGSSLCDAAFVGDIDHDGKSDIILTTRSADETLSWIALSAVSGRVLWTKAGRGDDAGPYAFRWLGDVDGDGVRDQVFRESDPHWSKSGPAVYRLVSGRTGELGAEFAVESLDPHAMADAGDLDGDGFAEIAIGFPLNGRPVVGAYSCHLSKWLWTSAGGPREKHFGLGVAGGRDFDGDGVADVIVSSPSEGIFVADRNVWRDPDQIHVLSGKDGRGIDTSWVPADDDFGSFGESVAFVDDADGDGKPEIVLGDGDDGFFGRALWILSRGGSPREVPRGDELWHFGRHVCNAGDLDGDGAGDFLVTWTPCFPDQAGEVLAFSGASLQCLWKRMRHDLEPAGPPVEHLK